MSFTDSSTKSATAKALNGTWLHDVTNPAGTLTQYLYGNTDRSEKIEVDGTTIDVLGRSYPIVEYGIAENNSVELSFAVPYQVLTDDSTLVQGFRDMIASRNTIVYRDNRGRLLYGSITDLTITDEPWGQSVSFSIVANNYLESIA